MLLGEAQGVDVAHGFSYKAKILHTSARFPMSQHTAFYFPPSAQQMVPLSLQRGKYVISFYFPLFKQSGINYPPTSSVPLSFKKGASFLMLSFNQLSHACPLQEENILLHSCDPWGLHRPEGLFRMLARFSSNLASSILAPVFSVFFFRGTIMGN